MNNPIVITGVTGSIGGAAAKALARSGRNDLIIVGRNESKLEKIKRELTDINPALAIEIVVADLSSVASVKKEIETIKSKTDSLAGLLNVAAVFHNKRMVTFDEFEIMFATNHLAPFQLTIGLLDLLKRNPGSRVVTVTAPSTTKIDFDDLQGEKKFSSLNKFGASKMANLLFTFALARKLEGSGVSAIAFHPGLVKSDLTKEMPAMLRGIVGIFSSSPNQASKTLAKILTSPNYKNANGKFFNRSEKELKKPGYSGSEEIQDRLWDVSLKMIQ